MLTLHLNQFVFYTFGYFKVIFFGEVEAEALPNGPLREHE